MRYGTPGCARSEHGVAGGVRLAPGHRGAGHPRRLPPARSGRAFPDRGRPRADRPQALPAAPVPPAPVHPAAGAGLAAVGRRPHLQHRRPCRGVRAAAPRRRGPAAGGLRGAAAAAAGPVPPAVADVVPARPGRGAGRPGHEGAPCHRRRRGRSAAAFGAFLDLRGDAPAPSPPPWTPRPSLRARAAARQPAPAGARVPGRPVRAGPPGRHRARGAAGVAGGTRDVRRGACPRDQPEPPDRPGPHPGHRPDQARCGEGRRPHPRRDGERCPAHRGRRRPADTARQPRRTRRRARPAGVRPGLAAPRAARPGAREPRSGG